MATYSIAEYQLVVSNDFTDILIQDETGTIDTFSLEGTDPVRIEINGTDWEIDHQSLAQAGTVFTEVIEIDDFTEDGFLITEDGGIGVVVIRDTFKTYTYHLDECFILLALQGGDNFRISSPCNDPCGAPDSCCRTITFSS